MRGRGNDGHYDPDPTGTMTESDESNTIMSAPCHVAGHAEAHAAIKWFVKISQDHKLPESSAKSHQTILSLPGRLTHWLGLINNFCQRFSFLLLMILVMVKWSFNYGTIENIWCFKAHKSKNESILPSVPFALSSLSTSADCNIQNRAEGFCEHLNVSFLKVSSAIHLCSVSASARIWSPSGLNTSIYVTLKHSYLK